MAKFIHKKIDSCKECPYIHYDSDYDVYWCKFILNAMIYEDISKINEKCKLEEY